MSKCPLNKAQRRAFRNFLTSTQKVNGFILYFGIVQAYLQGMLTGGVKSKIIEGIAFMETEVPEERLVNLYNYIKDFHEGHAPSLSLKECLKEPKAIK